MTNISMNLFNLELQKLLDVLLEKEQVNMEKAAQLCADTIENNGVIHVFGSGHSIGFGLEMKGRKGSLIPVHQIQLSDFVLRGKVTLEEFKDQDNIFERKTEVADKLYDLYDIRKNDIFIIVSNSGINGIVIDMAIIAKNKGNKIIVVTSLEHTTSQPSRHPSGKKLYELADVVIDNCCPQGDALLETGKKEKVCSVSSIAGVFIAQSINAQCVEILNEKELEVPLLLNEKCEEDIEFNLKIKKRYGGRI